MQKQAPSLGRILTLVSFALSCFGLLLFLWLSFGGSIPLAAKSYRFKVALPEATTLAQEADVRISGVSVGRVKTKELDKRAVREVVEVEIKPEYAPIPRDTRAILRSKTLLGETYLELTPGDRSGPKLADGGRLPAAQVHPTVELDEIFSTFDKPTRRAFTEGAREFARAFAHGRGEDLNDALGNLAGTATNGERLLHVLDDQRLSLRGLLRNGSIVFSAINDRQGALGGLIRNSNDTFEATAAHDRALAETIQIMPTFLDESRATLARLARFTTNARPLVRDLRPAADDLGPTVRDIGDLSPDLEATFRDLGPLIDASKEGLPALTRIVRGAGPVVIALNGFLDELNPILSLLNFNQIRVAGFISNGTVAINGRFGGHRYNNIVAMIDPRSFQTFTERPEFDRGDSYLQPNFANRVIALGAYENTDCSKAVGVRSDQYGDVQQNDAANMQEPAKTLARRPACFQIGPSLYDHKFFTILERAKAPIKRPPQGTAGTLPTKGRP
jgi:phospholipid/cholesterol/gamma-HCH transport system substrate-binding protein